MTHKKKFINALERKPGEGRVPHVELVFFPTMELLGKVHPMHRNYAQWYQMSEKERMLHRKDMVDIYLTIAKKYEHSAINPKPNPATLDEELRILEMVREKCGNEYYLSLPGDATF